jgi:hypothetical protein
MATVPAQAAILNLADGTGLRSYDGGVNVLLLTFMAVKSLTEDRTVLHFDVSGLSCPDASLVIPVSNLDPGDPPGILEVYTFSGDGVVSIDEWDDGDLFFTFTGLPGGVQDLILDISVPLQAVLDAGEQFMSFSLRGGDGTDRFNVGSMVGLPDPHLVVDGASGVDTPSWSGIKALYR